MKIHGFFGRGLFDAAYVVAVFSSQQLGIKRRMVFLLDTGALRTTISDRDAIRLGIDYAKLEKHPEGALGIGGVVDTYIVKNLEPMFLAQEGKQHVEKLDRIFVLKHEKVDETIKRIPSVLGRDILNKYTFIYDRRNQKAIITDETLSNREENK